MSIISEITRMNKKYLLVMLLLIIGTICFFWYALYMRNDIAERYNYSVECIDEGKYDEAISILSTIGDYKDSSQLVNEARKRKDYQSAEKLFAEKRYDEAKEIFGELGEYEGSETYYAKCDIESIDNSKKLIYKEACSLQKEGKYEEALKDFLLLDDYMNSSQKVKEVSRIMYSRQ